MRIFQRLTTATVLASLVLGLVVACGGGGGANFAGIDRLGVSTGTISGFGSIIINGVRYEVNNQTAFDIDDSGSGSQGDLQVGQQVTIEWDSTDDGVTRLSRSVAYDDSVEGPIASIDLTNQSMVVLGQVVIVDAATSFDNDISPRDLTGLTAGDFVEVSGLLDAGGAVRATRIERVNQGDDDLEVRGFVESLDTLTETFIVNGLTVDYSGVINPPSLANQSFVEVEGDSLVGGVLIADKVELEDNGISGAADGDDGEIEGYITRFGSLTDFDVAGVRVTTNGQTTYEDGVAADLALNVKVEVEGAVNASGVLVAREVEIKSGDDDDDGDDDSIDGRVEGNVTARNTTAGTLVVAGVTITVTAGTRFEDQTGASGQSFGLDDIVVGNYVEVRGNPGAGATLTALIVERDDADTDGLVRGPAGNIDSLLLTLTVLGVPVTTDGSTEYRDALDVPLSAAAFFAAISTGSEVQVKFTQGGAFILAEELELEDSD